MPKNDLRTEAYGTLDEAAVRARRGAIALRGPTALSAEILRLQNELFVAGAELATAPEARERLEDGVSRVTREMVERLEQAIDSYMAEVDLPPKFVIPGGTQLSAQLDVARSVLRRAERRIVALAEQRRARGLARCSRYVNRASDLLFAMARFADEPEPELFEGRGQASRPMRDAPQGLRAQPRPRATTR